MAYKNGALAHSTQHEVQHHFGMDQNSSHKLREDLLVAKAVNNAEEIRQQPDLVRHMAEQRARTQSDGDLARHLSQLDITSSQNELDRVELERLDEVLARKLQERYERRQSRYLEREQERQLTRERRRLERDIAELTGEVGVEVGFGLRGSSTRSHRRSAAQEDVGDFTDFYDLPANGTDAMRGQVLERQDEELANLLQEQEMKRRRGSTNFASFNTLTAVGRTRASQLETMDARLAQVISQQQEMRSKRIHRSRSRQLTEETQENDSTNHNRSAQVSDPSSPPPYISTKPSPPIVFHQPPPLPSHQRSTSALAFYRSTGEISPPISVEQQPPQLPNNQRSTSGVNHRSPVPSPPISVEQQPPQLPNHQRSTSGVNHRSPVPSPPISVEQQPPQLPNHQRSTSGVNHRSPVPSPPISVEQQPTPRQRSTSAAAHRSPATSPPISVEQQPPPHQRSISVASYRSPGPPHIMTSMGPRRQSHQGLSPRVTAQNTTPFTNGPIVAGSSTNYSNVMTPSSAVSTTPTVAMTTPATGNRPRQRPTVPEIQLPPEESSTSPPTSPGGTVLTPSPAMSRVPQYHFLNGSPLINPKYYGSPVTRLDAKIISGDAEGLVDLNAVRRRERQQKKQRRGSNPRGPQGAASTQCLLTPPPPPAFATVATSNSQPPLPHRRRDSLNEAVTNSQTTKPPVDTSGVRRRPPADTVDSGHRPVSYPVTRPQEPTSTRRPGNTQPVFRQSKTRFSRPRPQSGVDAWRTEVPLASSSKARPKSGVEGCKDWDMDSERLYMDPGHCRGALPMGRLIYPDDGGGVETSRTVENTTLFRPANPSSRPDTATTPLGPTFNIAAAIDPTFKRSAISAHVQQLDTSQQPSPAPATLLKHHNRHIRSSSSAASPWQRPLVDMPKSSSRHNASGVPPIQSTSRPSSRYYGNGAPVKEKKSNSNCKVQ